MLRQFIKMFFDEEPEPEEARSLTPEEENERIQSLIKECFQAFFKATSYKDALQGLQEFKKIHNILSPNLDAFIKIVACRQTPWRVFFMHLESEKLGYLTTINRLAQESPAHRYSALEKESMQLMFNVSEEMVKNPSEAINSSPSAPSKHVW